MSRCTPYIWTLILKNYLSQAGLYDYAGYAYTEDDIIGNNSFTISFWYKLLVRRNLRMAKQFVASQYDALPQAAQSEQSIQVARVIRANSNV